MLTKLLPVLALVLAFSIPDVEATQPRRRRGAPEFDPRAAGAAVALLVGGVLLLSERRRRHKSESDKN